MNIRDVTTSCVLVAAWWWLHAIWEECGARRKHGIDQGGEATGAGADQG